MSAVLSNAEYRSAYKKVKALQRDGAKLRGAPLLEALTAAAEQQRQWNAQRSGDGPPRSPDELDRLDELHAEFSASLADLAALLGSDALDGTRDALTERLFALRADAVTLGRLPALHRLRNALERIHLTELLNDLATKRADVDRSLGALEHMLMASIIDELHLSDIQVGGFDGAQQTRTVEEFQAGDRQHILTTAQRVRRLAAERAMRIEDQHPDQATLIRREAAKRSRHRAVRETFGQAPDMLTALKPCWVMSPLVVSQLLPNDEPYFDVVIFDEASQVRPAEAIPAIARGRRLVVAGDERQLPPTDFFSGPSLGIADEEDDTLSAAAGDFESVLDALLYLLNFETLQWHYRSQDERLIAFSNAHLYDRSMLTFPGISGPECLRHVEVPSQPAQAGGEDSSNAEVLEVVSLILDHAERHPQDSLGVIAMGITHADRIDAALRRALRDRADLDEFFDESRPERFFIKNLERVQGDERDAIILTVGYGKGPDGRMMYRFGPLNTQGGERRLNVAITRARRRMTVVSSFRASDMDPERTRARGADLLRLYLTYAESRGEKLDRQGSETPQLNPFEMDIRDALEQAGVPVLCQYGVSGYRLDFAAKHPEHPGRLVLAIEADGASYHSSQTARDRDRLRQEHLERLGWRFHRIWSQEWFTHRQTEIDKVVAAYRAAVEADEETSVPAAPALVPVAIEEIDSGRQRAARPDVPPYGQIDDYDDRQLEAVVRWVVSDTLLRSREELLSEVMRELGFARRGRKIVARIGAAIDAVRR